MSYTLSSPTAFPNNDVCYITVDINGASYRGSGVIIGPHTVLTAAHMVYDGDTGANATSVSVFPGYSAAVDASTSQAVTGTTAIHHFSIASTGGSETQASSTYDFAIIDFSTTFSSWCGVETGYAGGTVTVTGYPAYPGADQSGAQSYRQWTTNGTVSVDNNYNVLNYGTLSTNSGNSGGPLLVSSTGSGTPDTVVGVVSTGGWAGQLTTSTWNAIANWQTADSSLWTTAPTPTQSVTGFVAAENSARQAAGWSSNLDTAGLAASPGSNSVIGWQSANLPTGHNAIVLDGQRSNYTLQIDANDQSVIHDLTSGQSIVVDGASYILFNGASAHTAGIYDQIVFIEGGANNGQDAQLVRLYEACFGRAPDLTGFESWQAQIDNGNMSVSQVASYFVSSAEFGIRFGTNPTDTAFVDALYQNVLGRAPDASGASGWIAYLGSLEAQAGNTQSGILAARAGILLDFSNSQECLTKVAPFLVDTTKGGYADSSALMDAATVLNQGTVDNYLNLNLVDSTTISSKGVVSFDYAPTDSTGATGSGFYLSNSALYVEGQNSTVVLNTATAMVSLDGNNNSVSTTRGTTTVVCNGQFEIVTLAAGSTTQVTVTAGGETVRAFTPGQNILYSDINTANHTEIMLTATGAQPVAGANLNFSQNFYVLKIGAVGTGTAAEVATAANAVYTTAGQSNELLELVGQTSSGDTVIYQWGDGAHNPDVYGTHQISQSELYQIATLVGVNTQTLTAHDLT